MLSDCVTGHPMAHWCKKKGSADPPDGLNCNILVCLLQFSLMALGGPNGAKWPPRGSQIEPLGAQSEPSGSLRSPNGG